MADKKVKIRSHEALIWTKTIQKTLSLGQYVENNNGQFVAYDGKYATILKKNNSGAVRICKGLPAYVYLGSVIIKMQYNGHSVVHISYQK